VADGGVVEVGSEVDIGTEISDTRLLCGWRIERERRGERRRLTRYSTRGATVPPWGLFMARAVRVRESRPRGVCPQLGKREGFPS